MKDYSDYSVAQISKEHKDQIDLLQAKLSAETGCEVILVAYEEKNDKDETY